MMALLRKIDHELVDALLSRRLEQVRLGRVLFKNPSQAEIETYCKKHGWNKDYFAALKCESIFTS